MDLGIENRIALVCGASRGIGRACAEALAREGSRTVLLARTEADLFSVMNKIYSIQVRTILSKFVNR